MTQIGIEVDVEDIHFSEIIKHTKDNINFVCKSSDSCESLDALLVNIKNALVVLKEDVESISKDTLSKYLKDLKKSRAMITFFMNKGIANVESIIASLPKDNYDSMSKEELIDLLRNKDINK